MPSDRKEMGIRLLLFFGLLLASCAQVQPLNGGDKDERAPEPNFQSCVPAYASTELKPSEIKIPFNEFIKLNSPSTTVTITPELPTKPELEVKGKDLYIRLESQELLDNTTYSILFNKAISDINEGNDTTFTYVFATGKSIDSLGYAVLVIDAELLSPVANAVVGLYLPSDSLNPYKDRPKYVAQTDKNGLASFNFLAKQDLAIFAYWNKEGGKILRNSMIGFLNESIHIDTTLRLDTLYMFAPNVREVRGRISKKELTGAGRIELVTNFEQDPSLIQIRKDDLLVDFLFEQTTRSDSSYCWIQAQENSVYTLSMPFADSTLSAKISTRKLQQTPVKYTSNIASGELEIKDTLALTFDVPIAQVNGKKILVFQSDSIERENRFEVSMLRSLKISSKSDINSVVLLPEAVQFYDGSYFKDSIVLKFNRKTEKKYANMELSLENKPQEILLLNLYRGNQIIEKRLIPIQDSLVNFLLLEPGEYIIQVVSDSNQNGLFDTGEYATKRQPERVIWFRQPIMLRANWDTKQTIEFLKPD